MDGWKFRDELYNALNQWYLLLAFILLGALIGFAIAYFSPAPYMATSDLYVGIDVVRVNEMEYIIPLAEEEPLNLDDYKNWQLKQVADILTSDIVLKKTLNKLQQADDAWNELTLTDLRKAIDIYWYDTGTWRLEVVLPQEDQSVAAVETWLSTGHEKIAELLEISQSGSILDQQIWSLNLAISAFKQQRAVLLTAGTSSIEWISELEELPPGDNLGDELYSALRDWVVDYQVATLFNADSPDSTPEDGQQVEYYIQWFSSLPAMVDLEVEKIEERINILESERESILPEYHQYQQDSLGLSSNIVLLPNTSGIEVTQAYSSGKFIFGGSILGLLVWVIYLIFRIRNIGENNEE